MTKKRSYGFLTTGSMIIEVKASNARTAMRLAEKEAEKYKSKFKKHGIDIGKVTSSYVTYGKYGFAPTGIYKQVKKKIKIGGKK